MNRYICTVVKDENGVITDITSASLITGNFILTGDNIVLTHSKAFAAAEAVQTDTWWKIQEDSVGADREASFAVSCIKSKEAAVGTDWNSLTAEQQKLIMNLPLNDTEKDTVNAAWP